MIFICKIYLNISIDEINLIIIKLLLIKNNLKIIYIFIWVKTWIKVKSNKKNKIKTFIDDLITWNTLHRIEETDEEIYIESSKKVFRNEQIQQNNKNKGNQTSKNYATSKMPYQRNN